MKKQILSPEAFCTEKHYVNANGRILFSTATVKKFCEIYTYIDFNLLNEEQVSRLKEEMIDLYRHYKNGACPEYFDGKKLDINI